jgi:hypothetical protein
MDFSRHWADYFRLGDGAFIAGPLKEQITFAKEEKNAAT